MTQETHQHDAKTASNLNDEFKALPLEEKFAKLFQLELQTLNETMKYVADSSMKLLEKIGDAISDFGSKLETEAKKAKETNSEDSSSKAAETPMDVHNDSPKNEDAPGA